MSSGSLLLISCTHTDTRLDPSRYFNLSSPTTIVLRTPGGRTSPAIPTISSTDQTTPIAMIILLQHTNCTASPGDVEANVRADIQALMNSEYVRSGIQVLGYVLEGETGMVREVSVPSGAVDVEARQRVLGQMDDFGPFWG